MIVENLYWREPFWLGAVMLPLVVMLFARLKQKKILRRVADPHLLPWVRGSSVDMQHARARGLFVIAWLLFCIALAGPRTPRLIPPELQPPGAVMVTIIDGSASMTARDVRPDRRGQAQKLFKDWLSTAPGSLRMGIVIFAGHAHVLIKPSDDHALLHHYIDQLPGISLPTLGNNLAQALQATTDILHAAKGPRYVVVLTDGDLGEDARRGAEAALLELSALPGTRVQLIGLGGTEAASVPGNAGGPMLVDGAQVVSRRDAQWLQQLAGAVDGRYQAAESLGQKPLAEVLGLPEPRINITDRDRVLWNEWFALPLVTGMLLMLFGLSGRRGQTSAPGFLLVYLVAGCLSLTDESEAAEQALLTYEKLFNEATGCYRLADYPCALQAFSQAAWMAPDDRLRGRAAFNLGNTHFYLGDYEEAAVLFAEAGRLGVAKELVQLNQSFADSLAAAVRRRWADIAESERRAGWRAAARGLPGELDERLADGRYLPRPGQQQSLHGLSAVQLNNLVSRGLDRLRGAGSTSQSAASRRQWVESPQQHAAQNTAGLFNQLLPMEIGLPVSPEEPYRLEGQRPW